LIKIRLSFYLIISSAIKMEKKKKKEGI